MDLDYILNNRLIDRYLAGKLSSSELSEFEAQLLWSSDLLAEVELTDKLRHGLRELSESGELRRRSNIRHRSRIESFFTSPRYALAASVMLVLSFSATTVLFLENGAGPDPFEDGMPARIYALQSVRGNSQINDLPVGSTHGLTVLTLDPGPEDYDDYRISLYRDSESRLPVLIRQIDHVEPDEQELLAFAVPTALLTPGKYTVEVEGWRNGWPAGHDHELVAEVAFRAVDNE